MTRLLPLLAIGVGVGALGGESQTPMVHGVSLPTGSQQVGENRYRVPLSYPGALDLLRKQLKVAWKPIINQPGIRAVHFANPGPGDWEGINVYERESEVRVYVMAKPPAPKKAGREDKKPAAKGH